MTAPEPDYEAAARKCYELDRLSDAVVKRYGDAKLQWESLHSVSRDSVRRDARAIVNAALRSKANEEVAATVEVDGPGFEAAVKEYRFRKSMQHGVWLGKRCEHCEADVRAILAALRRGER